MKSTRHNTIWTLRLQAGRRTHALTFLPDGGICRPWSQFSQTWASAEFDKCKTPGADAFSLVMGAFGGFMKIVEPISRMKHSTDQHQKTIVILILVISSIPALIGCIVFFTGCADGVYSVFQAAGVDGFMWGPGSILFFTSVILLLPITIIHTAIPAHANSAMLRTKQPEDETVTDIEEADPGLTSRANSQTRPSQTDLGSLDAEEPIADVKGPKDALPDTSTSDAPELAPDFSGEGGHRNPKAGPTDAAVASAELAEVVMAISEPRSVYDAQYRQYAALMKQEEELGIDKEPVDGQDGRPNPKEGGVVHPPNDRRAEDSMSNVGISAASNRVQSSTYTDDEPADRESSADPSSGGLSHEEAKLLSKLKRGASGKLMMRMSSDGKSFVLDEARKDFMDIRSQQGEGKVEANAPRDHTQGDPSLDQAARVLRALSRGASGKLALRPSADGKSFSLAPSASP